MKTTFSAITKLIVMFALGVSIYFALAVLSDVLPHFIKWSQHLAVWELALVCLSLGIVGLWVYEDIKGHED